MYNQTLNDLARTNNEVEGWHHSFQANVGAYHPYLWKFIDILKREQNLTQVNIAQAQASHQPGTSTLSGQQPEDQKHRPKTTKTVTSCSIFGAWPTTSACEEHSFSCFGFMPTQTVLLKTTNLPEVVLLTIALSVSYTFEKP